MEMTDIQINYSNDKLLSVALTNDDGSKVNLTDCTVLFTVKSKSEINTIDATDSNSLFTKEITTFTSPTDGTFSFSILASDTVTIGIGKFYYDFKVVNDSGLQYSTRPGELEILRVTTQRTVTV